MTDPRALLVAMHRQQKAAEAEAEWAEGVALRILDPPTGPELSAAVRAMSAMVTRAGHIGMLYAQAQVVAMEREPVRWSVLRWLGRRRGR